MLETNMTSQYKNYRQPHKKFQHPIFSLFFFVDWNLFMTSSKNSIVTQQTKTGRKFLQSLKATHEKAHGAVERLFSWSSWYYDVTSRKNMTKQNRIISNYDVTLLLVYRKKAQTEKKNRFYDVTNKKRTVFAFFC